MGLPILPVHQDDLTFLATRKHAPEVIGRALIERAIVRKTVETLLAAGFILRVDYGGGEDELCPVQRTVEGAMANLMACDEEWLRVYRPTATADNPKSLAKYIGKVFFVYGNEGWTVIADYALSLEEALKPANDFAETLEEGVVFLGAEAASAINVLEAMRDAVREGPSQVIGYDRNGDQQRAFEHGWNANGDRLYQLLRDLAPLAQPAAPRGWDKIEGGPEIEALAFNDEQIQCLRDPARNAEAHAMLDDLRDRVGFPDALIESVRAHLQPLTDGGNPDTIEGAAAEAAKALGNGLEG